MSSPNDVLTVLHIKDHIFHPNLFTFGGVIAERVNTVFCPVEHFHDSPETMHRIGRIIIV